MMNNFENIDTPNPSPESGYFEGKRYNISKLYAFAESIPTETVSLEDFKNVISPGNESWTGTDGKIIGPYNIFRDWQAAQENPLWANHVESIKKVDLDIPILVSHTGHVIDGQHRVVRSFIEKTGTIRVKRLPPEIPQECELES